jgi:hypothetical protein
LGQAANFTCRRWHSKQPPYFQLLKNIRLFRQGPELSLYLGLGKMLIWIAIYKLAMPYLFLIIGLIGFFKNALVLKSI